MNHISKEITLNVGQPNNFQLIHAMKGDNNAIEIVATLYNTNTLYTIDTDKIVLSGTTPSGTIIENNILTNTEHTVTFELTKNMLASNGDLKLSIVFIDTYTEQVLSSFPFVVKIINAPIDIIQESELTAITDYVLLVCKYATEAEKCYENLISMKGEPSGVAELDENGRVPLSQTYCVNEVWSNTEPQEQRDNDYWLQEY